MRRKKLLTSLLAVVFTVTMVISAYGAGTTYTPKTTLSSSNVTIKNVYSPTSTTPGTITIAANTLTTGDIITAKMGSTSLGTVTISDPTTAAAINVTAFTKKKGTVSLTVSPTTTPTLVSKAVSLGFDAQKSPVVTPTAVSVTMYSDKEDVLTVAGSDILAGDVLKVYPVGVEKAQATGKKATAAGTATVSLGKNTLSTSTGIRVTITHTDCTESDKVLINNASGATFTMPTKTTGITTSTAIAVTGGVLVSGLSTTGKQKITIYAYKSDPTQYLNKYQSTSDKTALAAILLGKATSVTGGKASYIFIPYLNKTQTTDLTVGASVYVVSKYDGTATDKTDYKAYSDPVILTVK